MNRILLQEYGEPCHVRLSPQQANKIMVLGGIWKNRLGLEQEPISVKAIGSSMYDLRANGITGIVRVDDIDMEIAPKFISPLTSQWKGVLWRILLYAQGGFLDQRLTAAEVSDQIPLCDLMANLFLRSFNQGKASGLPQKYSTSVQSGPVLGGSFDYSRLKEWFASPWIIPFITDSLSQRSELASLLGWAATRLSQDVVNPQLSRSLRYVSGELSQFVSRIPALEEARRIVLGPQYRSLQGALSISILMLEGRGASYGAGEDLLSGFLWNSDVIYENFVFSLCTKAASKNGLVASKMRHNFGELVEGSGSSLVTIPDVVFSYQDGSIFAVADSKYKKMSTRPRSTDTYQILAAGHVLGARKLALIYPASYERARTTWRVRSRLGANSVMISMLPLNFMALTESFDLSVLIGKIDNWLKANTRQSV